MLPTPDIDSGAAQLLPAIDRHGGLGDYQPLSQRAIHTRLARATTQAHATGSSTAAVARRADRPAAEPASSADGGKPRRSLDEVLELLDQVADDADALNGRIQALLDTRLQTTVWVGACHP